MSGTIIFFDCRLHSGQDQFKGQPLGFQIGTSSFNYGGTRQLSYVRAAHGNAMHISCVGATRQLQLVLYSEYTCTEAKRRKATASIFHCFEKINVNSLWPAGNCSRFLKFCKAATGKRLVTYSCLLALKNSVIAASPFSLCISSPFSSDSRAICEARFRMAVS